MSTPIYELWEHTKTLIEQEEKEVRALLSHLFSLTAYGPVDVFGVESAHDELDDFTHEVGELVEDRDLERLKRLADKTLCLGQMLMKLGLSTEHKRQAIIFEMMVNGELDNDEE